MGVARAVVIRKPLTPPRPQKVVRKRAICAAMAPTTMPKLRPSPASTGMMRERTRKEFRATRVNSSPATKTMDCFEAIMAPMLRNTKMRTTFCSKSQVFVLAK